MNNRLAIQDIAAILSEKTGRSKSDSERFLRAFVTVTTDGLMTDKLVKVKGLGIFKLVLVEQRESVDVNTGDRFVLPAHYKCSFLPDTELRDLVNEPFSFFETIELAENVDIRGLEVPEEAGQDEAPVQTEVAKNRGRKWSFWSLVGVFFLVLCGAFVYLYFSTHYTVIDTEPIPIKPMKESAPVIQDDVEEVVPEIKQEEVPEVKKEEATPFKEVRIIKVGENDRLTTLAERYYGSRAFWVYIYQFNKTVIRNPDVINVGMELILPDPALYGIDANDSTSIRKALVVANEIKALNK